MQFRDFLRYPSAYVFIHAAVSCEREYLTSVSRGRHVRSGVRKSSVWREAGLWRSQPARN
jgi:hypothetical protein